MQENATLEFKRAWSESAKKSVVAFANTDGGTLLVGIDDDSTVCGLSNADETAVQIVNSLTDGIKPDVGLFVKVSPECREGKFVVVVEVARGSDRPYYLSDKGLRPSGVYVRRGASSVPASDAEIRAMIKASSGDSFEETRAVVQDLTFVEARRVFGESGLAWGSAQMRTLGLVSEDGLFTNLAWLLSDQCTAETKAAVFQGNTKLNFRTRREFSGSLLRQFRELADFLDLNNGMRSTIADGLHRVDVRDYPPVALREALLNSIVHRDYSFVAPTLVSVFDSKIEFLNLGGLPKGLTKSDAMIGVSVQRNPKLAQIFYRLRLVEAYGTGIPKIIESYESSRTLPLFEVSDNAFKVVLPSFNGGANGESVRVGELGRAAGDVDRADGNTLANAPIALNASSSSAQSSPEEASASPACASAGSGLARSEDAEQLAVRMAARPGGLARADLQRELGVSQSTAIVLLRKLVKSGKLATVGGGRSTRYVCV